MASAVPAGKAGAKAKVSSFIHFLQHENFDVIIYLRVTTCLENVEMSGNLTAVREMSGILLKIMGNVWELSGKKS